MKYEGMGLPECYGIPSLYSILSNSTEPKPTPLKLLVVRVLQNSFGL